MCPRAKFHGWTAMKVLFLISFPFLCHSQTALKIINSTSPIEALLGQNVTIPCVLTDRVQPQRELDLDLFTDSVRWDMKSSKTKEHTVYLLTNGHHTPYRQKSNVEGTGFKKGNASLTLYNVQKSDEGEYICNVFVAGNKLQAVLKVEVSVAPGNEQSVTCYVCKFYPKLVDIRWEKRSASSEMLPLDKETCTSVPTQADDGTFNVTSLMSVKPSSVRENGDEYSCIVSHRSFKSDHVVSFTVTVKETSTSSNLPAIISLLVIVIVVLVMVIFAYFKKFPPEIADIAGLNSLVHGKRSKLYWMVSGFKPRKIEICAYLQRGDQRQEICSWKYPPLQTQNFIDVQKYDTVDNAERGKLLEQKNGKKTFKPKRSIISYNYLCSTSITPDKRNDNEAELVIEVKHAALKTTLTKSQKLNIKGDYFTAHIMAPQPLKHGEEVTLTCDITKCDPGPLFITWLRGEQVIYKDGKIQDTRYKYTETRDVPHEGKELKSSSSLMFTVKVKEDHNVKYTCNVNYSAIETLLKPYREAFVTAQPVVEQITSKHVSQLMELSCRVHSFHPQTIGIKWFKEKEELPTTDCELCPDEDGLYSTTSTLMYVPETEDIVKTFRCEVDHQSLPNPETREWKLEKERMTIKAESGK